MKIDVYNNIDEEPAAAQEPGAIAVRVLESLDDMALVASIEVITKTVRESNEKNELSRRYARRSSKLFWGASAIWEARDAPSISRRSTMTSRAAAC